jgi:hypothetical protein
MNSSSQIIYCVRKSNPPRLAVIDERGVQINVILLTGCAQRGSCLFCLRGKGVRGSAESSQGCFPDETASLLPKMSASTDRNLSTCFLIRFFLSFTSSTMGNITFRKPSIEWNSMRLHVQRKEYSPREVPRRSLWPYGTGPGAATEVGIARSLRHLSRACTER